jgi:hypothetical protein
MTIAEAIAVLELQLTIVAHQDVAYARNDLVNPELKQSVHAHHEALKVAIPALKQAQLSTSHYLDTAGEIEDAYTAGFQDAFSGSELAAGLAAYLKGEGFHD